MRRDLTSLLAVLHGGDRGPVEATIALMDLGDRMLLAAEGIIDTQPDEGLAALQGLPTDFAVTPYGYEIIEQCARWRNQVDPKFAAQGRGEQSHAAGAQQGPHHASGPWHDSHAHALSNRILTRR